MKAISAHDAKQNFGAVLAIAAKEPVEILRYRRRAAVLLSAEEYDRLHTLHFLQMKRRVDQALDYAAAGNEAQSDRMIQELPRLLRQIEAELEQAGTRERLR